MMWRLALISNLFFLVNGANILGVYFHAGKSHHILGEMLLKELARKGHNVTMASPFPLKEPFPNYTDIHLTGILEDQLAREEIFMKMNAGNPLDATFHTMELTRAQTELTLKHPEMAKLVQSGIKFDVIIIDWFMNSGILIFGKLFNAPVIPIASHGTTHLANSAVGNPAPPSYVPCVLFDFPQNMTFFQRMANGLISVIMNFGTYSNFQYNQKLLDKYYPNAAKIEELVGNIALVLSNGHYSFESPRPFVPNMIPVGGFHVEAPKKLSKDVLDFIGSSKVIYFSLGSNMKSTLLPETKQKELLRVFAKLPYKVLWKWEKDDLPGKPSNVLTRKWFPQNDILAHPNLNLFISHGGLLSTIESLHHGVPVLGIPIFGDQRANINVAVKSGYALKLELSELNEETFSKTLEEILNNPRYSQNAKDRSQLLRDQPLTPMETAVFWVEHVIRHKGAPHLKNTGVYLSWYQYLMLDVVLFIASAIYLVYKIIYYLIKSLLRLFIKQKDVITIRQTKKTN